MRIRMLTEQPEGAVLNGAPWPGVGEEADVPTAQAAHLIGAGVAEAVDDGQEQPAPEAEAEEQPAAPRRRKAADRGEAT